jgi:hypothetical protein
LFNVAGADDAALAKLLVCNALEGICERPLLGSQFGADQEPLATFGSALKADRHSRSIGLVSV